jgi:hypothetical protein
MYPNKTILLISAIITLCLLTTGITLSTPVKASSKGGGSVAQEQVNSGNSNFDKLINKFYNCISKTHQDPPTIEKVDSCYYLALGEIGSGGGASTAGNYGVTGPGTSTTSISASTSHHHKHGTSTTSSGVAT